MKKIYRKSLNLCERKRRYFRMKLVCFGVYLKIILQILKKNLNCFKNHISESFIFSFWYVPWNFYAFFFSRYIFLPKTTAVINVNLWSIWLLTLKGSRWNFGVLLSVVVGHIAHMGERGGVYRVLVGKPERNRPYARLRRRWEDNIKMACQELGWGAWTGLIWLSIETGGGYL